MTAEFLDLIGWCEDCGMLIFDSSNYVTDEAEEKYWHKGCRPKSNKGIE